MTEANRKNGKGLFSGLLNLVEDTIGLKGILIKPNTSGAFLVQAIDPDDNADSVSTCPSLHLLVDSVTYTLLFVLLRRVPVTIKCPNSQIEI